MAWDTWIVFALASLGLSLSPGPNGLLALTHGALHGARRTLFTIGGGVAGFTLVIAASMFGVGALVLQSAGWLVALKWAGGAYLVWLGLQVWRSPPVAEQMAAVPDGPDERRRRGGGGASLARQGFLAATTNPKGLLFFVAFLPQFIDPAASLPTQFAVMAATFAATEIATELALARTASRIRPWLARVGRRFNQACGGVFVALGLALPLRG